VRAVAAPDGLLDQFLDAVVPGHPVLAVGLTLFGEFPVRFLAFLPFASHGGDAEPKGALQVLFGAGHAELGFPFRFRSFPSHRFQVLDNLAELVLDRPENLLVILDDGT